MNLQLKQDFLLRWENYFPAAPLPVAFYYTSDPGTIPVAECGKGWSCIVCELAQVRKGKSLAWDEPAARCGGAKRYLGFADSLRPNFEYFLSYGIPGEMEGERYIQSPELVKGFLNDLQVIPEKGRYIVFKRWDMLEEQDEPEAVIFFATPDVLSGLYTLVNFDRSDGLGVIAPFSSGCGSIIYHARLQQRSDDPKAILGMFDPSARPCVPKDTLSFTIPMRKFEKIIGYMEETFLITETWETVKKRL